MIFEEICKPRISDFGKGGKISLTSLLCIMEDCGSHHSTYANDDVLKNSLNGSAWVCTNWRVKILTPPAGMRDLKVSTWAREKTSSGTVLREYTICDPAGSELVLAEAKFVRLDLTTGKPVRISDELYDAYGPETRALFEEEMTRLVPPETFDGQEPVVLRKSDVDFNGHVHNTRYLDIAAAGVPQDRFNLMRAKEISIAYRKPLKETDATNVAYALIGNSCFISINNEQGPCCYIQANS